MKKRFAAAIIAAIAVTAIIYSARANSKAPRALTDAEMSGLIGGDGCFGCSYGGTRYDECAQAACGNSCSTTQCFSNYALDSSCQYGTGTCQAQTSNDVVASATYMRECPGCSGPNSGYVIVASHLSGPECSSEDFYGNCLMASGACNGTLDSSESSYPGISCN